MGRIVYNSLQLREVFHLEFLRWLGRKMRVKHYAIKGGANLRFFFNGFRYSEDIDLDVYSVKVHIIKDITMKILQAPSFQDTLKPFSIGRVATPDIARAKQTETTQRFKIHLITSAGEDLFTKIEFSRRGFKGRIIVQPISNLILRVYNLPPLLVPHYDIQSAIMQKIGALVTRSAIQARDIFDLYILSSQYKPLKTEEIKINDVKLTKACENVFEVGFEQFRDTVVSYLSPEDQSIYNSSSLWDEIKLKVVNFIDELRRQHA